jgi:glycosyltransferase involved in cell wall biosynthesis
MKALYHITNLPPKIAGTEASLQEAELLRDHFGGRLFFINPNQSSPLYLPRLFFGLHLLKQMRAAEREIHIHHLYNADPYPFPVLLGLRRPVIYSISSGVGTRRPLFRYFAGLAAVTVADERSLARLQEGGLHNVHLIRPGIDTARFTFSPLPLTSEIRLMVGSAPWTTGQFRTKGIDALLAAARQSPDLRLVFLWRGVLREELDRRVRAMGLAGQVEVIDKKVDVNRVLAGVHASVVLASDPAIVRAYPHSLIESLAAGKPVILNRAVPMSDYVEQLGCGQVIKGIGPGDILAGLESLARSYETRRESALLAGRRDFSQQSLIASFEAIYNRITDQGEQAG